MSATTGKRNAGALHVVSHVVPTLERPAVQDEVEAATGHRSRAPLSDPVLFSASELEDPSVDGDLNSDAGVNRRRVPRRDYEAPVGVLVDGEYHMARAYQLGEGGMLISCPISLEKGQQVVTNFVINSSVMVIVRGVVRNLIAGKGKIPFRYGLEFISLEFAHKRTIRNFVASGEAAKSNPS